MNVSLRLERYFFKSINIEANLTTKGTTELGAKMHIDLGVNPDDACMFQVTIKLDLVNETQLPPAYKGGCEIFGYFRVGEGQDSNAARTTVAAEGAAMLYDSIREMITNITCRGPWGAVILPLQDIRRETQLSSRKALANPKERPARKGG